MNDRRHLLCWSDLIPWSYQWQKCLQVVTTLTGNVPKALRVPQRQILKTNWERYEIFTHVVAPKLLCNCFFFLSKSNCHHHHHHNIFYHSNLPDSKLKTHSFTTTKHYNSQTISWASKFTTDLERNKYSSLPSFRARQSTNKQRLQRHKRCAAVYCMSYQLQQLTCGLVGGGGGRVFV